MLDVFTNNDTRQHSTADALIGDVRSVLGSPDQPSPFVASKADILYKTGLAAVDQDNLPVEQMLLPAFFPREDGFFSPRKSFTPMNYLRLRCRQAFTAFTIQSPYLLLLRAIELSRACIANALGAYVVNQQSYKEVQQSLRATGLEPTSEDVLDRLVKKKVSDTIEGSPRYFKREKLELDAMVRMLGLPSHFITITMNETGLHRAPEYVALDQLVKQWDDLLSWQNLPLECNRVFLMRFTHVWDNFLVAGPKVLGDIQDYAIRFECQGRGSLHAHICIWLPQLQAQQLDNRIIAFVPADHDTDTGDFVPPQEPLMRRLYLHAKHKQQHTCRTATDGKKGGVCDGHCKLGFP
jgi:hypothetical protein